MKVWFQLFVDGPNGGVLVDDDADIDDLRHAVKMKSPNGLKEVDAAHLNVYAAGADPSNDGPLRLDAKVADLDPTTYDKPLLVVVDEAHHQPWWSKRVKTTQTFDMRRLLPPLEVQPPIIEPDAPVFTCNEHWLESAETEIQAYLDRSDETNDNTRIPPMIVARCSRGGKTRALHEIAHQIHTKSRREGSHHEPVATILVSFNEFSGIRENEQDNPVKALCQRIAFAALKQQPPFNKRIAEFQEFISKDYDIGPEHIREWIGQDRALLLVDELNNLSALNKDGSKAAREFGDFIKYNFIFMEGRYLVFSSHVLSTVSAFGEFLDPSQGSARHVTLQELPLVDNLYTAMKHLNSSLDQAREAIYCGLMPGMIYLKGKGKILVGKRELAVMHYNKRKTGDKKQEFKNLLRSLVSGDLFLVPVELHILLDAVGRLVDQKIRWVPFHLQYVMERINLAVEEQRLASALAKLCSSLVDAGEASGKGWEALFVLFLVIRCITNEPDGYFVQEDWFVSPSPGVEVTVQYNPYHNAGRLFRHCKDWDELKEGIIERDTPTISIFYPSHAQFKLYDVIVVYSVKGEKFESVYGYQLKEGKANPKKGARSDFSKSFVVKGAPVNESVERADGWCDASGEAINDFFGESGIHWTPQEWTRLTSTCQK